MTRAPNTNDGYYTTAAWRTPAEIDTARWEWLQQQGFPLLARALDDIVERLERLEHKLDAQQTPPQPRRSRRKVADEAES